ncbi:EAL domain-containing protein [Peteryoungia desertarenae]|uniref:EAL domain-containing protein n=1 Tax=Peteryoungia desertarenae TaxID=1813451 RepID=A0ABX6QQU8_9HYPH|nr:bifunctional diguanylate cyclase/phosphodiesterase [Peteryoungia desertarenae]QLF70666.1 EAL domain-containing protein [Peteryoungia desertarenae]
MLRQTEIAQENHQARGGTVALADLPLPAATYDLHGRRLEANTRFQAMTCDRSLGELLLPEDYTALMSAITSIALQPNSARSLNLTLQAGSDTKRHVIATLCAAPDSGTAIVQLTDITPTMTALADVSERESRWNNALVSSLSGVWDQYMDGRLYYSDMWRKIRGLRPEDPAPPSTEEWLEFVHPQDRERVLHAIARQNAGDPDFTAFEYREWHRDGYYVWIECRGACIEWDNDGNPTRISGTDTDISQRKIQEESLGKLSKRLQLALEVSGVGVFEADFEAGTTTWDDGMRRIFDLPDKSVQIGGLWEEMLHPDDKARVIEKVERHIETRTAFTDDYRVIDKKGQIRHIRANTLPYLDYDGHLKMIGVNWDMTEDHRLREELEKAKHLAEARNAELERTKATAEHSALHDYLTALPNRRYLEAKLESWEDEKGGERNGLAVLHVDLDRFKHINDTLGHNAGDAMLRHAAEILKQTLAPDAFAARVGGDEFVILVEYNGSVEALSRLANGIIEEMRKPVRHDGQTCRFGCSIGIAFAASSVMDARQLVQNADIALYKAKHRGGNRCEFYSHDTRQLLTTSRKLSDEILEAIELDLFEPYFQFQFRAQTQEISGAECLVRWNHPERGILGPDKFLAIADEIGVLAQIDSIILKKALAHFHSWQREGLNLPKISVNVSSKRLDDPDLPKDISALNIQPGTVSFELLESIFLDRESPMAVKNLSHLRNLGIDIEVDDFGTGHASIVGLLNLKPRSLKIDRQLINDVPSSAEQRTLAKSIIEIARSLKIQVIAEGVETQDHARILKHLGCDILQGFGLARPMSAAKAAEFMRKR